MQKHILLFLLFFVPHQSYAIYFKHIGKQEGLSQVSVLSIYQDELGRMWFGTEEGVNVYDGRNIITYKPLGSTQQEHYSMGNAITQIVGDKKGNIFLNADNTLIHYNIHKQIFKCIRASNVTSVNSNNGTIWAGISDSIFIWKPDKECLEFVFKLPTTSHRATHIKLDYKQRCWVATDRGLYLREKNNTLTSILSYRIYSLFEDSKQNLWISTRMNGLYKKDKMDVLTYFYNSAGSSAIIANNQVRGITEDNFGNIWFGTFQGLNKYDPTTNHLDIYKSTKLPGSLTHSSVFPVYKDKQGTIWLGTYYGGVNFFNPGLKLFTAYSNNELDKDCLSAPFVGRMIEDKDNNIWICTEGGGLNLFNRKSRRFTHFKENENHNSIAQNNLKDIAYDSKRNKLYIGTHTGGLSVYDISRNKFENLYFESPDYRRLAGNHISNVSIWKDYLIFSTFSNVFKMHLDTKEITPLLSNECLICFYFAIDLNDFIWVTNKEGIWRINLNKPDDQLFFALGKKGLSNFTVTSILTDIKGRIFFGTRGGGICQYNHIEQNFTQLNTQHGQSISNYCYALAGSSIGTLIVSTDKGVTFFNPDTKSCNTIGQEGFFSLVGMNKGCGLLICKNGEIFAGSIGGMISFFEHQLIKPSKSYQLYFSDLSINGKLVYPEDQHKVLNDAMPYTKEIILKHDQNNFTLSFASNNYSNYFRKTAYEYQLEGFDERWMESSTNDISYTNLNPGKYILNIQEKFYDTNTNAQKIQLSIIILAPWYATTFAYCTYFLLIIGIIFSIYRFRRAQSILQNSLEAERIEKKHAEKLSQAKLQFFSNISHEFRTPLTLITSQIELLLQSSDLSLSISGKLLKIQKNTFHMRNLISELLDFRKLEEGHVKLFKTEQDIVGFLHEIYLSFNEQASMNGIEYGFQTPEKHIKCQFDHKQLQKVFYNLLSNAFKFNKVNASIDLIIENEEDSIVVKVMDNGIGISQRDIDRIFNCFYQVENNSANGFGASGTGIGLSLAKSIVELHHGSIRVKSTPGYGSIFIVKLPKGCNGFVKDEITIENQAFETMQIASASLPLEDVCTDIDTQHESNEESLSKYTVLLVEDNEELLLTLADLFKPTYRTVLARNGKEGLRKTYKEMPDIIVSDILMPEMTGMEMCIRIKNDYTLSHIPVILLTALSSLGQKIEGFDRGADDYISKPFDSKLLLSRCDNLILGRILLQKKFAKEKEFDIEVLTSNPADQTFLNSVHVIIQDNLNNEYFDMNMIANELCLSRSSFYTKFKALTGMTPNNFVLNMRLKYAASMLTEQSKMQLVEISDKLGFSSTRYFTRCFKAQFGMSPTEYRKKKVT